jgi:hypothetical protein
MQHKYSIYDNLTKLNIFLNEIYSKVCLFRERINNDLKEIKWDFWGPLVVYHVKFQKFLPLMHHNQTKKRQRIYQIFTSKFENSV